MAKILIVAGVFPPEPIVSANLMENLATELASRGHCVTVLRPKPSRPLGFKMPDYNFSDKLYNVVKVNSFTCPKSSFVGRMRESLSHGRLCAKYINDNHKDIDFIYNDSWWLFGVSMVAKAARKYLIPYVTIVQDVYPEVISTKIHHPIFSKLASKLLFPLDAYTHKYAKRVFTISEKLVEYLSSTRMQPKEKYVCFRNWQDETRFLSYQAQKIETSEERPFTFIFLGSISPATGLEVVLEAFKLANLKDARLLIAGSGSYRDTLLQIVEEQSISGVEFCDAPFDKVPEIQDKADVCLLPLKKGIGRTSTPSKLPAYMFSKKPIIASVDLDADVANMIRNANSGWIAAPEDAEDLAKHMRFAIETDKVELSSKGQNGFDYAMKMFTKKANLNILVNTCVEIIENKK